MISLTQISTPETINDTIFPLLTFIFGSGVGGVLIKYILEWRKNNRSFDIKMNELLRQNKFRGKEEIIYVPRTSLENELNDFLKSNKRFCKISGSAGSGKTRFALNITCKNRFFSKYFPVYIDKNNGKYFSSDAFRNLDSIQGNRRYVFIFDYVYENREAIKSLLQLTGQTHKHKYVFIEREYNYWEFNSFFDERDFLISMESHKMNQDMLSNVFINSLPYQKRKSKRVQADASVIIASIIEKIDSELKRPIFAKIAAELYKNDMKYDFKNIKDSGEIISLYWNNKFSTDRVGVICSKCNINVNDAFMMQLEILLRVLLLIATITRNRITITNRSTIAISINEKDVYSIITECCDSNFLNVINKLGTEELRQLFGVVLKEHVKINNKRREDKFEIVSELDIVSEWIFLDSTRTGDFWIQNLITFFRIHFKKDFINFLIRGSLDFPNLVEHLQHSASEDMDENEYYALLILRIHEAYKADNPALEDTYKEHILYMLKLANDSFLPKEFTLLQKNTLIEMKKSYNDFKNKKELTENLLEFWEN